MYKAAVGAKQDPAIQLQVLPLNQSLISNNLKKRHSKILEHLSNFDILIEKF